MPGEGGGEGAAEAGARQAVGEDPEEERGKPGYEGGCSPATTSGLQSTKVIMSCHLVLKYYIVF